MRQGEAAAGHWDMTAMVVDMRGKALLFKHHQCAARPENRSDFRSEWPMT